MSEEKLPNMRLWRYKFEKRSEIQKRYFKRENRGKKPA